MNGPTTLNQVPGEANSEILAVHLMYSALIETYKILCFVWKEKKNRKNKFYKGWPKIKGTELGEGGRKLEGPKNSGTKN